ncbi:hypothetical protein MLD52_09620 [Puniceicoccaceae bacterium K14]|nr:hypothetical protein [Puniceicoccaceae bacterium K14]
MPNEPKINLEVVRRTSVQTLTKLPHEQLDRYIRAAERDSVDAAIVLNWLVAIKTKKTIKERKGGSDD